MTRDEIEQFFTRRNDAWGRHDIAALTADHAEDGEVDSPLWGHVRRRAAIQEIYVNWFSSFPDVQLSTEDILIDGDRAVQFGKMVGTHGGVFCGMQPTGKRFTMNCAFLFTFTGSKIAFEKRIYDFTFLLMQLGVLQAKPAF
jgi:predicted ester cyclase